MGIDASTNSLAFCIMREGLPEKWGEITFTGTTVYDRMLDARLKVRSLVKEFDISYVAIEKVVRVNSVAVAIKMSFVVGQIIGELVEAGARVEEVYPITWQSYIGNNNFTRAETAQLKKDNPGRSPSWLKAEKRRIRKQRTMDHFNSKHGINLTSDNVGDSFGLAWYASKELVS
jgi:Holliday junction resolvasome RuvABC endonuclease subunit